MRELSFRQWHHGYLGLLLLALSYLLGWPWLHWIAWIILLDDVLEHTLQALSRTEWPSPLRVCYGIAYARFGWLRAVNRWLDELFT